MAFKKKERTILNPQKILEQKNTPDPTHPHPPSPPPTPPHPTKQFDPKIIRRKCLTPINWKNKKPPTKNEYYKKGNGDS